MRWFKHLSNARNDEDMAELLDTFGAEGYGIWCLILEKISSQMDKTERCFARYSVKKWAKSCEVSAKKFQKVVSFLSKLESLSIKTCDKNPDFLTIECSKLLKLRDEYSKKSGQTPDKRRTKSVVTPDQETEVEAETKKQRNKETEEEEESAGEIISFPSENLKQTFEQMKTALLMSDHEINATYAVCSEPDKLTEAVQCALEYDADLREKQTALNNPGAYIRSCYNSGKISAKTRFEKGDNRAPATEEKIDPWDAALQRVKEKRRQR